MSTHQSIRVLQRPIQKPSPHGRVKKFKSTRGAGVGIHTGDGGVTNFHDGGGRVLAHPRLALMFWGNAWTDPSTTPSQGDFTNAVGSLVSGPWGTQLSQYRRVGPMTLESVVTVTSSDPPATFTDPQIQTMITEQMQGGVVPPPDNSIDRIYCVLMPTGHSSSDNPGDAGQHQYFDYNSQRAYWAWITNDGTLTGGNSIPKVALPRNCRSLLRSGPRQWYPG
jgi:hypothetical protein